MLSKERLICFLSFRYHTSEQAVTLHSQYHSQSAHTEFSLRARGEPGQEEREDVRAWGEEWKNRERQGVGVGLRGSRKVLYAACYELPPL